MANSQSRGLFVAAFALAVFAAVVVISLMRSPGGEHRTEAPAAAADTSASEASRAPAEPEVAAEAEPAAEPQAAAKAEEPASAKSEPVDLFAGPMPDFMADLHKVVLDKKPLSAPMQKQLYDYGKEHPDDARPQLLLAWDSRNREWDGFAVRMYRIAFRADRRSKQDPSMLRDLIDIASRHDRVEYRETTELLREAFGGEAIGPIEEAIERHRQRREGSRVDRLQRLKDALSAPTP